MPPFRLPRAAMLRACLMGLLAAACHGQDEPATGSALSAEPSTAEPVPEQTAVPGRPPANAQSQDAPLLDAALALARLDHPTLDESATKAEIERLSAAWAKRLATASTPRERAAALAAVLFEESGFSAVDELDSARTLHVDSVLATRHGYCLSLSVVALAMAQHLGEPLYGVAAPNHFFVRWDDGSQAVDIELTRGGTLAEPEVWRERLHDFLNADTAYLRNLTSAEVAAVLHHNRGFVLLSEGRHDEALAELQAAALGLPGLPETHRSLGILYGEREAWSSAIEAFEQALDLYPGDVDALVNLALCRHATGDPATAIDELELALLLDPGRERAAQLLDTFRAEAAPLSGGVRALDDPPPGLSPGLLGHYHEGRDLRNAVARRVDRTLDFDWKRDRPLRGVPRDRFSVRWTGWFKAPTTATYTLFVVANDGVRIRFGDTLAVDHWQAGGYSSWTGAGDAQLARGWHPLQVDYFDQDDNARLLVIIGVDGQEYPLELADHLFHQME